MYVVASSSVSGEILTRKKGEETQTDRHCQFSSRASLVISIAVGGAEAHTSPSHFPGGNVPSLSNIS